MPNIITKEKIKLKDIDYALDEQTIYAFEEYDKNACERLGESIDKYGWNPDFGELPYHHDSVCSKNPLLLWKQEDGKYKSFLGGQHRRYVLMTRFDQEQELEFYVIKDIPDEYYDLEGIKNWIEKMNQDPKYRYQTIKFPGGLIFEGRDDSEWMFNLSRLMPNYFCGKTVLDIACNFGGWCLEAKKNGASEVIGFDLEEWYIERARKMAEFWKLDIDYRVNNFWTWDWNKQFNIVMVNQCIYHFGQGKDKVNEILDKIANATKDMFIFYSFVLENDRQDYDPEFKDGYRPTISKLVEDLHNRGFQYIEIFKGWAGKSMVVANKNIKKYFYKHEPDDNTIYMDNVEEYKYWENKRNPELYPKTCGMKSE